MGNSFPRKNFQCFFSRAAIDRRRRLLLPSNGDDELRDTGLAGSTNSLLTRLLRRKMKNRHTRVRVVHCVANRKFWSKGCRAEPSRAVYFCFFSFQKFTMSFDNFCDHPHSTCVCCSSMPIAECCCRQARRRKKCAVATTIWGDWQTISDFLSSPF